MAQMVQLINEANNDIYNVQIFIKENRVIEIKLDNYEYETLDLLYSSCHAKKVIRIKTENRLYLIPRDKIDFIYGEKE